MNKTLTQRIEELEKIVQKLQKQIDELKPIEESEEAQNDLREQ